MEDIKLGYFIQTRNVYNAMLRKKRIQIGTLMQDEPVIISVSFRYSNGTYRGVVVDAPKKSVLKLNDYGYVRPEDIEYVMTPVEFKQYALKYKGKKKTVLQLLGMRAEGVVDHGEVDSAWDREHPDHPAVLNKHQLEGRRIWDQEMSLSSTMNM